MADSNTESSRQRPSRRTRTVVLDTQWPFFKRTLSKQPGGLGPGIPFSSRRSRARKSPRAARNTG